MLVRAAALAGLLASVGFLLFFLLAGGAKGSAASASASWYGPGLYGNSLACGGHLTTRSWGFAHKSLPCWALLRVCFRGRCALGPVRDRGPFVAGRELDITAATARWLRFSGVQRVTWSRVR